MDLIRFNNGLTLTTEDIVFMEWSAGEDDLDLNPERTTRGRLIRGRVVILPSFEFTVKPFNQKKMMKLMDAVRPESFFVDYYHDSYDAWFRGEFYVPSNDRKPKPLRFHPNIIYQPHKIQMIAIDKARRL